MVEPPEDDLETGYTPSSSFGGCCSKDQEPNIEDVAIWVNVDELEVVRYENKEVSDDWRNEDHEDIETNGQREQETDTEIVLMIIDDLLADIINENSVTVTRL